MPGTRKEAPRLTRLIKVPVLEVVAMKWWARL
jgi:hypothetical protein